MLTILNINSVATEDQVATPTMKPSIRVDPKVNSEILAQVETENTVIVHCSFKAVISTSIRIWSTTFLIDKVSKRKSKLLHAINIPFALAWLSVTSGTTARFTLIFSALPKDCKVFDLIEIAQVHEAMNFTAFNIKRNASDVYNVEIEDVPF
jgi:hypothetical protein